MSGGHLINPHPIGDHPAGKINDTDPDSRNLKAPRGGTGRRGPEELWLRFDAAVARLNAAGSGDSLAELVAAYGEVTQAAGELADALEAAGE